jgi:hypothetical protein
MLITAYDLPRALGTCSRLATHWDQQSCVGGVFMENFSNFSTVRSRWLRSDDLLYPCNRVARRYKWYCYDQVTSRILRKVDWDWHRTARICRTAERDWVGVCFQSFGRDVSSFVRNDGRRGVKMCRIAGRNMSDCVYAMARDIVNQDGGRYARVVRFCNVAPSGLRPRCYRGIGTVVAVLQPTRAGRDATCRRLSRRWAANCIAGTR